MESVWLEHASVRLVLANGVGSLTGRGQRLDQSVLCLVVRRVARGPALGDLDRAGQVTGHAPFVEQLRANQRLSGALAAITAAVVGVILNLSVWFALHVLFGEVTERWFGPVRWFAFNPLALDLKTAALAAIAALLAFRFHRGLIEVVAIMAALGIAMRFTLGT